MKNTTDGIAEGAFGVNDPRGAVQGISATSRGTSFVLGSESQLAVTPTHQTHQTHNDALALVVVSCTRNAARLRVQFGARTPAE